MKRDNNLSFLLWKNGMLSDRRSHVGYSSQMEPHLRLFGLDMKRQRERVFLKSKGKCRSCRVPIDWDTFEMDHIVSKGIGGCDCLDNLQALCGPCHVKKHNRYPKFGTGRAEAIKDFEAVYGKK